MIVVGAQTSILGWNRIEHRRSSRIKPIVSWRETRMSEHSRGTRELQLQALFVLSTWACRVDSKVARTAAALYIHTVFTLVKQSLIRITHLRISSLFLLAGEAISFH